MLNFFTDPYKDELMYSAIARYHFYSGNKDYKDTIEECFGKRSVVPALEFGGRFEYLSNELGGNYTSEKIIRNHTIYPFYEPFLEERIKKEVFNYMKIEGCNNIYTKLGIVAGSICKSDYIKYCPLCSKEEIERIDEVYIHREHQLQGIRLCPHHGCLLKNYSKRKFDSSKIEYIRLEKDILDLENSYEIENYEKHLKLARSSYYILTFDLKKYRKEDIRNRYLYFLYKLDLSRETGTINQRKLYEEFIEFYGDDFLESLESFIDYKNEYNWLKVISRKSKRASHPLRHLLFINFLCNDIREFFETEIKIKLIKKKTERDKEVILNSKTLSYRNTLLNLKEENKNMSRTELRKKLQKEYTYLYRYDSKWLFSNLPDKDELRKIDNTRINWEERDREYLELIKKRYEELIKSNELRRITKGLLAKSLGILTNIEKRLDKLPETEEYLNEVCESVKEFQIRRCKKVIDDFIKEETHIRLWEVQKIAAIRTETFNELKEEVINYIEKVGS